MIVEITNKNSTAQRHVQKLAEEAYAKLPKAIRQKLTDSGALRAIKIADRAPGHLAMASYNSDDQTMTLSALAIVARPEYGKPELPIEPVFNHEIGHAYDLALGGKYFSSRSSESFLAAMRDDIAKLTPEQKKNPDIRYLLSDPAELFADSFGREFGESVYLGANGAFPQTLETVHNQLSAEQHKLQRKKAGLSDADHLLDSIDGILQDGFSAMAQDIAPELIDSFQLRGAAVLKQFNQGAENLHLVDQYALKYARERGAELIVQVSDSTKEYVRQTLSDAIETGWSAGKLAYELRRNEAFNPMRALRIARTETVMAHRAGSEASARIAGANKKQWNAAPDACELCRENVDAGVIDMDASFPNGTSPHPSCACDISYQINE